MKTIVKVNGPYIRPDSRKIMVITYGDGSKSTMTYARYLVLQGRDLLSDQVVHHQNEDKTDDRLDNFRVMTNSDHVKQHKPQEFTTLICYYCGSEFTKLASWERRHSKKRMTGPYCSRSCQGKVNN